MNKGLLRVITFNNQKGVCRDCGRVLDIFFVIPVTIPIAVCYLCERKYSNAL